MPARARARARATSLTRGTSVLGADEDALQLVVNGEPAGVAARTGHEDHVVAIAHVDAAAAHRALHPIASSGVGWERGTVEILRTRPKVPVHTGPWVVVLVEVAGFEPACSGDRLGLLRAQPTIRSRPSVSVGGGPRGQPGCDVPRRPPDGTGGVSLLSDTRPPTAGPRGGQLPNRG